MEEGAGREEFGLLLTQEVCQSVFAGRAEQLHCHLQDFSAPMLGLQAQPMRLGSCSRRHNWRC